MLSVPYPGSRARTAEESLEQLLRKNGTYSKNHKPLTVHRLDRDTSGVMMFALTEAAQKKIMDSWHQMVTERLYHAVAENPLRKALPDSGLIDSPLAYNAHNIGFVPHESSMPSDARQVIKARNRNEHAEKSIHEKSITFQNGKAEFKTISARTHFKVLARGETHTLFELSLDTGRKNQIRAHLADSGYPLCGDENYRARTNPFGRLALHARTLEFTHPFTGEKMKFEIPESPEWEKYVTRGDKNAIRPAWSNDKKPKRKNQKSEKDIYSELKTEKPAHISKKQLSKMDFISRKIAEHRR